MRGFWAAVLLSIWFAPASAELIPMAARASLLGPAAPGAAARGQPSLFVGKTAASLFAAAPTPRALGTFSAGPVAELRNLIARAEAGPKGYDAVQYGAWVQPPAPPTRLTLGQIYTWIDDTPGMPHAIGRYQFIPATLRRLARALELPESTPFTPAVQDALADLLLKEAGLKRFLAGDLPRRSFMNNLAKIWAGLPNDTGKSHYHGYAGNKATMTWAAFDAKMFRIFPTNG